MSRVAGLSCFFCHMRDLPVQQASKGPRTFLSTNERSTQCHRAQRQTSENWKRCGAAEQPKCDAFALCVFRHSAQTANGFPRLQGCSEWVTSQAEEGEPMSPNTQVALIALILFFAVAVVSIIRPRLTGLKRSSMKLASGVRGH